MTVKESEAGVPARSAPGVVRVLARNPSSLQDELTKAVEQVRDAADAGDRRGILITRRSRSLFTVEASATVDYGTTLEKDRWHRSGLARSVGPGEREGL